VKKERKDDSFLKKPWYKGGSTAMSNFIGKNIKYPKDAMVSKVEGKVRLRLSIDHTGQVVEAKVQAGIGYGCDEEAVRVSKLLKFEVAKTPRKLKVIFHRLININFKIPKQKTIKPNNTVQNQSQKMRYSYIPSPSQKAEKQEQKEGNPSRQSKTYTYTINI
jgi:protein TonB